MSPHVLTKLKETNLNLNVSFHRKNAFRTAIPKSIVTRSADVSGRTQLFSTPLFFFIRMKSIHERQVDAANRSVNCVDLLEDFWSC